MNSNNLSLKTIQEKTKKARENTVNYTPRGDLKREMMEDLDSDAPYVPPYQRDMNASTSQGSDYRDNVAIKLITSHQKEDDESSNCSDDYGLDTSALSPELRKCGYLAESSLEFLKRAPKGLIDDIEYLVSRIRQLKSVKENEHLVLFLARYTKFFGQDFVESHEKILTENYKELSERESLMKEDPGVSELSNEGKALFVKLSVFQALSLMTAFKTTFKKVKRNYPHVLESFRNFNLKLKAISH